MGKSGKKRETFGISFPMTHSNGARSTSVTTKKILAKALESHAPTQATDIANEKNWRFGYRKHVENVVKAMAKSDKACLEIAEAGLKEARTLMTFRQEDGTEGNLELAMETLRSTKIHTGVVEGSKRFKGKGEVPEVKYQGKIYKGKDLVSLARMFVAENQADKTFADSVAEAVKHPEWFDLRGKTFVLIGATSEMGPLDILLQCGADVVAIARKNSRSKPDKWKNLLARVQDTPGRLLIPISRAQNESDDVDSLAQIAGADAILEPHSISNWLTSMHSSLYIYNGIYLDGEGFVRASIAMDIIVTRCKKLSDVPPTLIYIDTPSHVHFVPSDVPEASKKYRTKAPSGLRMLANLGMAKSPIFLPAPGGNWAILDGLSIQQGPNYAVAKLLQRWRAVVARYRWRCSVSITTGPPAKTDSVMHSKTMAFVMNHAHEVKPNTAHMPETVQALMSIVMVRDCHSEKAMGAKTYKAEVQNLMEFIVENAWHGGMWCAPYDMKSTAVYLYANHYVPKLFKLGVALGLAGVVLYFSLLN